MADYTDIIKVINKKKDLKWYYMVECTFPLGGRSINVCLPAGFLKQVGLLNQTDIDDNDFMIDDYAKLDFLIPSRKLNIKDEIRYIIEYMEHFLPTQYNSEEYCKKLYYIIRIAAYACILSIKSNNEIDGIQSVHANISDETNKYSRNLGLIKRAFLDKGKIIGPLEGQLSLPGWKIINMIYTMIWCNSNIRNNKEEFIFVLKMIDYINASNHPFILTKVIDNVKYKLDKQELSCDAWMILFLYIRNYQWYFEYLSILIKKINIYDYCRDSYKWNNLYYITGPWARKITPMYRDSVPQPSKIIKTFEKELNKMDTNLLKELANIILDEDVKKKNKKDIKIKVLNRLKNGVKNSRFILEELAYIQKDCFIWIDHSGIPINLAKYGLDNIPFWICVESIIFYNCDKTDLPLHNNLDFIQKAGVNNTFARDKKGKLSVYKLKKVLDNIEYRLGEKEFNDYYGYESIYIGLTKSIRKDIMIGNSNQESFRNIINKYEQIKNDYYHLMKSLH